MTIGSMDGPCALRNNGHPSQSEDAWLNGAQTGDTVQCSGPFPFDSHSTRGGMTPMRRLLSPGGSERCSLHGVGAGERGDPSLPSGLGWKSRRPHRPAHRLRTHPLS